MGLMKMQHAAVPKFLTALMLVGSTLVAFSPAAFAQMSTPKPMMSTTPEPMKTKSASSTKLKTSSKSYNDKNDQKPVSSPTP